MPYNRRPTRSHKPNYAFERNKRYWEAKASRERKLRNLEHPGLMSRLFHWFICGTRDNKFLVDGDPRLEPYWGYAMDCTWCGRHHEYPHPMPGL